MITELGHLALCLALAAAAAQSLAWIWGLRGDDAAALRVVDHAAQIQFLGLAAGFAALTHAYVVSDFSVLNVALNSHSSKPLLYKVTGVWANHEGSMLLWVLILALFGFLISLFGRSIPLKMRASVLGTQGMIGLGFLLFILLTSNPFERVEIPPLDGRGMNPLLQDIGVALHPPLLYLGYVGFSTAFSFAVAALVLGRADPCWARWMRPWILLAWSTLTAGIALGSWWAYYELGWGGFWFWDPVENASFMPWLLGGALLHSAIVVEKRAALISWTVLLAVFAFALSLIGTFLVRSGVLSSVHAFATDPARGVFILILLALYIGGAFALYAWRSPSLGDDGEFDLVSRENGLLINNFLLAAACGVVFVGTLYPLFLEALNGAVVTVGAPYFNKAFLPIFGAAMVVAGLGPLLSWKRANRPLLVNGALFSAGVALLILGAVAIAGRLSDALGLLGLAIAIWLAVATLVDLGRRADFRRAGLLGGLRRIAGLPRSAAGLYLGHLGLAIAAAGVVAVSVWKVEAIQVQQPGAPVQVGGYQFTLLDVGSTRGPNYRSSVATVKVETADGAPAAMLFPERRWYPVESQNTTEAAIVTLWHGDLYAVLGDPNGAGGHVTRYYYNPGVPWMWFGGALMTLAGLISLTDRRLRVGAPGRARAKPDAAHSAAPALAPAE